MRQSESQCRISETVTRSCFFQQSFNDIADVLSMFHSPTRGKLGFIEYNGRIRVHTSLLYVVLHDQLLEDNANKPNISGHPSG